MPELRDALRSGRFFEQEAALRAVAQLAVTEPSRAALASAGVFRTAESSIVAVLLNQSLPSSMVEAACNALEAIAGRGSEPAARAAVLEGGAPAGIVAALGHRKGNAEAAAYLSTLVRALSPFPEMRKALGGAGIMQALIDVLKEQAGSAAVVHPACEALGELTADDANRLEMFARGSAGMLAVCDALRRNECDAKAASAACALLSEVRIDGAYLPLVAREATPAVVSAMKQHKGDAAFLLKAMSVLSSLMMREAAQTHIVYAAGPLPLLLEALELHKDNGQLCDMACHVLLMFIEPSMQDGSILNTLRSDARVGNAITAALRMHASRPILSMEASIALSHLAAGITGPQRAALLRDGAAQALVAGLKANMRNTNLIGAACCALTHLARDITSDSESTRLYCSAAPATSVAVALRSSLSLPPTMEAVDEAIEYACRALLAIASIPSEAPKVARLGYIADVAAVLVRLKMNRTAVAACCSLLDVVVKSTADLPVARRGAAVAALADAIQAHETDRPVVLVTATAIAHTGCGGAAVSRDVALVLVRALEHHKASGVVCTAVTLAIRSLVADHDANRKLFLAQVRCARNRCCQALHSFTCTSQWHSAHWPACTFGVAPVPLRCSSRIRHSSLA